MIAPGRLGWYREGRPAGTRAAPDWLVPQDFGDVGALVVTPLPGHGVPAGALVLLRRSRQAAFSDDEELFAAGAGVAMSAAHVYAEQASITEVLLRDLLPPTLCEVGGVVFAGRYRAAADTDQVGGDFYDVHPSAQEGGGPLGNETFGEERLRTALAECGGMPAEGVAERIHMLAMQWAGRHTHDDMAVVTITAPRGAHRRRASRAERRRGEPQHGRAADLREEGG